MADSKPTPIHSIQHTKFSRQDGWRPYDISLCSSGNIAVSGGRYCGRTFVCIYSTVDNSDSRDKPTLLYEKEFEKYSDYWLRYRYPYRYISFIKPNSTEIVTCVDDNVTVLDYNRDVVLRSRKVNGNTTCLSVSESQIFIGLDESDIVHIYDNDLNRIKSIKLKEIRGDCPRDISAVADRLYVCTTDGSAIVYSQTSGSILSEYTTVQHYSMAWSITVNVQLCVVAVLWYQRQVAVYSFTNNNCLVVFDVKSVTKIRISDQGRIVTGNKGTGEVKIYDLAQFFTYNNLKSTLSSLFSKYDLEELVKYFKISDDSLEDDSDGGRDDEDQAAKLLTLLEEKQFFQDGDFHHLKEAFSQLGKCHTSIVMNHVDFYQQYVADKNTTNYMQTSEDNESGHNMQLDGFSEDWSPCDMSLGSSYMVVAGYCNSAKKTSLDFICKDDSGSWSSWVKTREFERGGSDSERFVSFIDEHRIVTCCGNVVEIVSCDTNKTEIKRTLQSTFATCITVRNQDVYIGFKESANILVLNRDLEYKTTVTLREIKTMWPIDLAATPGKLLVCLKNNTSSKALLFDEKNGQKLVEYKNVEDENKTPQSVAVNEESDLVGILWPTNLEEYDWEEYDGHISLHSLTHGYCLSVVAVALTFHGCCDDGCSSFKRIQLLPAHVAVMDDLGGVRMFDMKKVFTEDNVTSTLCKILSSKDCEGSQPSLENDDREDDGSCSGLYRSNETENGIIQCHEKIINNILAILKDKRHVDAECVYNLRETFSHDDSQYDDRVSKIPADREILLYGRLQQCRYDQYHNVNISFASSDMFAVSFFCNLKDQHFIFVYHWDCISKKQSTLSYYRKFHDGSSVPLVSFLGDCKAVTCCDDLIEIITFKSHAEVTTSLKLSNSATCMATRDRNVYLGFRSSEIIVLDSDLVQIKTIHMKSTGWPEDLAVIPGRLFVCTAGSPSRALSFSEEDGGEMIEYNYLTDGRCTNYLTRDKYEPGSISVSESNDLVGISWHPDNDDYDEDNGDSKNYQITLHSLSEGSCLAVLDEMSGKVLRFCEQKALRTFSSNGNLQCFHVDQHFIFQNWKTLLSFAMSYNEYEKMCKFYGISEQEIAEKEDVKTNRVKCLLEKLDERGVIQLGDVSSMKGANEILCEAYIERLCQPIQAYMKYSVKSSTHVALSLLDLRNSLGSHGVTANCAASSTLPTRNPSQLYPGQPLLRQPLISSLPGPSNAPSAVTGKRVHYESQHLYEHRELSGKRMRIGEEDSQYVSQASHTSSLQLNQGDHLLQPASVPTPRESLTPVTGSAVLHEMLSMIPSPSPSSSGTGLLHHFNDTVPVLSGQQRGLPSTTAHPSQHEPLLTPLAIHQPVGSEVIQQSGTFTELNPPNQVWQIGESQVRQQGSNFDGPSRSQQSVIAGMSQTPQLRGQIGLSFTPQALPHLRHSMPSNVRQPLQPQLRHSMPPQLSHSMGPNVRQQLQPQASRFRPLNLRQTVLPQVGQSSQPQTVQAVELLTRSQFGQIGLSCTPQALPHLRHSMPSNVRHPLQPQAIPSMPPQLSHSMELNVRQQLRPQGSLFSPMSSRQTVLPQVGQSSLQPQIVQALEPLTRSQLASKVTQNEQRDSLQGGQSVDYSTSQQARHSLRQQQMQSLGPPVTENSGQIIHQNENTTRPHQTGDNIGQQTLQLRQADMTIGRERTEHEVHMVGYSGLNTQQNIQQTTECTQPPGSNTQQNIQQTTECIGSNNVSQQDRPDTEFDMGHQELVVTESRTTHETSVPSTIGHESVPTGSHVESDQLIPVTKSHFQKLKYIHEELGHLLSSSKSPHPLQDVQGTSSVSGSEKVSLKIGSEYEQEAVRYLESLPEADKSALLAFKDMGDDREELVRRLVENIFTGEERKNGNCWGAGKYQKLDGDKLKRLRQVTFYLCPIRTRKQFSDKLEDKEWKRLCGVIDVANRHYRQELNRQKKGR